jgi:hypothetical protein
MDLSSITHLLAQAQTSTQPQPLTPTSFDWTSAFLGAFVSGTVVAAAIKAFSDTRLAKQTQRHSEEMQRLQVEHERQLERMRQAWDNQKLLDEKRSQRIEKWQQLAQSKDFFDENFDLLQHPIYASLRLHLRESSRNDIENIMGSVYDLAGTKNGDERHDDERLRRIMEVRVYLIAEIARIEQEWGLL